MSERAILLVFAALLYLPLMVQCEMNIAEEAEEGYQTDSTTTGNSDACGAPDVLLTAEGANHELPSNLWHDFERTMHTSYGFSWQAAFVGIAVIAIPWSLFLATLIERGRKKARAPIKKANETAPNSQPEKEFNQSNTPDTIANPTSSFATSTTKSEPPMQSQELKTKESNSKSNLQSTMTHPTPESVPEEHHGHEDDANAAPLHLHAMRMSDVRLRGRNRSLRRSSSSRSNSRSRSASPAHTSGSDNEKDDGSLNGMDDILTDRMGLEEMEPHANNSEYLHNSLPPVNERMSEETLDDCHAFSDVLVGSTPGRRLSAERIKSTTNLGVDPETSSILETLAEQEEDLTDDEDDAQEDESHMEKQRLGHEVLFELLGTVSHPHEKEELKKAEVMLSPKKKNSMKPPVK